MRPWLFGGFVLLSSILAPSLAAQTSPVTDLHVAVRPVPHRLYLPFESLSSWLGATPSQPVSGVEALDNFAHPAFGVPAAPVSPWASTAAAVTLEGAAVTSNVAPPPLVGGGGRYLLLDGNPASYAELNDAFVLNGDATAAEDDHWTIEFWMRHDPSQSPNYPQHLFGDATGSQIQCYLEQNGILRLAATTGFTTVSILNGITTGTWHHVAFVYSFVTPPAPASPFGLVRRYLDGAEVGTAVTQPSQVFSHVGTASNGGLRIGGFDDDPLTKTFQGGIDDFRVWYTARSGAQIHDYHRYRLPVAAHCWPDGILYQHPDAQAPHADWPSPFTPHGAITPVDHIHGEWRGPFDWRSELAEVSVPTSDFEEFSHAVLITTGPLRGHCLLWTHINALSQPTTYTCVVNPDSPESLAILNMHFALSTNIFCGGQTTREDGKIIVAGGLSASSGYQPKAVWVFDPTDPLGAQDNPWSTIGDMVVGRYYPTTVPLPKDKGNRAVILGGNYSLSVLPPPSPGPPYPIEDIESVSGDVIHDETANAQPSPPPALDNYPRARPLSDGRLLVVDYPASGTTGPAPVGNSYYYDMPASPDSGPVVITQFPTTSVQRLNGSMVHLHYRPANDPFGAGESDVVLSFGGSRRHPSNSLCRSINSSVDRYVRSDATNPDRWVTVAPMKLERFSLNAVLLPTGEVFLVGGNGNDPISVAAGKDSIAAFTPAFVPEIYTPGVGSRWAAMPNHGIDVPTEQIFTRTPRLYHSVALLLADGSVLVAGGEELYANRNFTGIAMAMAKHSGEIYCPPYMFQSPRPSIMTSPDTVNMSTSTTAKTFDITVEHDDPNGPHVIDRVVLMRPGAVTHHFDNDQFYIELDYFQRSSTISGGKKTVVLRATAPLDSVATEGNFLLFVVLHNGPTLAQRIPSRGAWIRFN